MMLVEETTVPQSALPVAQLREHLRLGSGFSDDDLQDVVLENYLRASIAAIEARTGKILIEREFSWTLTAWRDGRRQPLPVAPVNAISGVMLIDMNGDESFADGDAWYLEPDSQRPSLKAVSNCLPAVPVNGSVRIGLLAGFGPEWGDLPADLSQAVLMLAAHYYEYRHEVLNGAPAMPFGVASLIERYRTVRLLMGGRV
ncbi:head-tail connector protein [Cognatiyoonia sp. IB215446]|uniref:head-tail connector protein n=1 Tax=Cognatiyoonia sp. IB215446 TaxID=3097355 RepID=UPI002A114AA7|nr:head-tail connector protein [Cognatiyoonia sp. IB215446]MDX8349656.1 head-tail connector protein [Cognatiyoonia sp. IB215446]